MESKFKVLRLALVVALTAAMNGLPLGGAAAPAQNPPDTDGVRLLLQQIERAARNGRPSDYLDLLTESADRQAAIAFTMSEFASGATRVVVRERDREPLIGTLPGNGYHVSVDVFSEFGARARSASWRLDVKKVGDADDAWRVADQQRISVVENLFRLSLSPAKQYSVRDLKIAVEDLELAINDGSAFVAESEEGVTALVLLGRGEARFHPAPEVEKGQLKIFCGAEMLEARFDTTFIRLNPLDLESLVDMGKLTPRGVDPREFRRADDLFREEVAKSFAVDMSDLSRDLWSLTPSGGDLVAEIHTTRYDTLTYARAGAEAEDISFFDRKRHRNISVYASKRALARFGRSPSEDELVAYDVLGYDLDVSLFPDRSWIDGVAQVHLRVRAPAISSLTLRLAESLVPRSVISDRYGRLMAVRVRNQNTLIINLPAVMLSDDDLVLTLVYSGRLEPQRENTEGVAVQGRGTQDDAGVMQFQPEASFLYSNRSYWYPQATVTDYATARIRITIPANLDCVASGDLDADFPVMVTGKDSSQPRKMFQFTTTQPLRYLAFVVSRFVRLEPRTLPAAGSGPGVNLMVQSNPRQVRRSRELADRASDIIQFYQSIIGDSPYPSFTLAVLESDLPGGHSPGYFAALNQPLPSSPYVWRNDPASFEDYPEFFIAHELAHQWWGQAVGWRNYHEQWLSEGFAQYFAALYAQRRRGDDVFAGVLRQFRRFGMQQSPQGPVYLGYRLGHIKGDSRVFRAIVYNKSAAVLHMLRRLMGDEAFFSGLRRFYNASRYRKAGTAELREAMETAGGRPLDRFFERWIYGSTLPRLKVSYRTESTAVEPRIVVHVEQVGDVFDVPLTVTLQYADKKEVRVVVPVTDRVVDFPIALAGTLRSVEFGKDETTLADITKN